MKPSLPLTIYIATSARRNFHAYRLLRDRLIDMGHRVLDWSSLAPPLPPEMPALERMAAINTDKYGDVFRFCTESATSADLVIYLGPAGQEAAGEICMAYWAGVRTMGLPGLGEAPGTILARAVKEWFMDHHALLAAVEQLSEEKAKVGVI